MKQVLPTIPETSFASKCYWLGKHTWNGLKRFVREHIVLFTSLVIIAIVLLFISRPYLQHLAITIRLYSAPLFFGALGVILANWLWLKLNRLVGLLIGVISIVFTVTFFSPFEGPRQYLALWWQYTFDDHVTIDTLPLTEHERIHPRSAVHTLAQEGITEVQEVSDPSFVRDGDSYNWTMAIEPAFLVPRLTGTVNEVMSVPADRPALNFSGENRDSVVFSTGEGMIGPRNSQFATIKRFGLWRYFNYEPANVRYIRDDAGAWAQVISLIRWKGWFLPRPTFGGVMIIRQNENAADGLKTFLTGAGEWISPKEIADVPYLRGQNLIPKQVSTFVAESFRFTRGFFAPMPGYHLGDIRVPNLPGDQNDQPFTCFFDFGDHAKLYHYFALEPFQADKQGLNTSLFVPADGVGPTLAYRHYDREEALTGVSAVVAKVMESRKNYDWSQNSAAEQRPVIRDINGKRRFFWLTTVVTHKEGDGTSGSQFIAGAEPDITLTDANYNTVVWVNARKPDGWTDELKEELSTVWDGESSQP
ncbi:hypothetical protein [Rubellicoccus peritrichatus]|uniref:Uncharacterized protein n=1 Tax=Rubellicoccus peritrichatus TaxID=3080537 RepID=A0AAQ3LDS1_9BACT|nr:hypothetical protein [Puniceicoccus sp. CR14]WOO41698.1 hypothetical protein RZN69_01260 [Puniceicoccus sp. CR14]